MGQRISVLAVHENDQAWMPIRKRLEQLLSEGLIRDFLVTTIKRDRDVGIDPEVEVFYANENSDLCINNATLLSHLASLGEIDEISVTALRCDSAGVNDNLAKSSELHSASLAIRKLLVQYAGSLHQRHIRFALIGEGEKAPGHPFFTPLSDVNLVSLPRDISMSRAVARPIVRENNDLFVSHAAMELSSALGLWQSMDSSPLDDIVPVPLGRSGYRVHLCSSRVKGLLTPPLPISELVDDSSELPLPANFAPVDNLNVVIERYADSVYPENMIFNPLPLDDPYIRRDWRQIFRDYVIEFVRTIISIPSVIGKGFKAEIDLIGANALDTLLGSVDARVRPIIPVDNGHNEPIVTAEMIEEVIKDIEYREGRPIVGAVTTDQWESIITEVLGLADAHPQSDATRLTVMPSGILVRDKTYLAPNAQNVGDLIRMVMPPNPAQLNPEENVSEVNDDVESTGEDEQPVTEEQNETLTFIAPGEVDLEALRDAVRNSGMSRPDASESQLGITSPDLIVDDQAMEVDREDRTLVGRITARFDTEFKNAEDSVIQSLSELRALPNRFGSTEFGGISRSVVITIALALGAIVVSLATHGWFREFFAFDWLSARNRDFAWVAFSSIVLVLAIATLPGRNRRNWQSRTMITVAICAGILAVEYVAFDPIRDQILQTQNVARTAVVAFIVLGIALVLALVSILRNAASDDPIRKRVSRILSLVLWFYVVVGASSFIAGPESFIIDWTDSTRHRALIATQFVGWVCLVMATLVIIAVRVRQQNAFGVYAATFMWAQDNLIVSIDARRHLRAAYTQWLLVAAMVARTVWYPLGREAADQVPFSGSLSGDETILKFDLACLELSDQGKIALLAQLKQMFVRNGWLRNQFDYARNAYQSEIAMITGDASSQHDPISCPSVPSVDDLLENSARGDRFRFTQQLMEGRYDSHLLSSATHGNLDAVYANILSDGRMHHVTESQNQFETGLDFLVDIIPSEEIQLPPNLLNTLHLPSDDAMSMKSHLWWPQTSILHIPASEHATVHSSRVLTNNRLNDSVIMLAILAGVSDGFLNSDVAFIEDSDAHIDVE